MNPSDPRTAAEIEDAQLRYEYLLRSIRDAIGCGTSFLDLERALVAVGLPDAPVRIMVGLVVRSSQGELVLPSDYPAIDISPAVLAGLGLSPDPPRPVPGGAMSVEGVGAVVLVGTSNAEPVAAARAAAAARRERAARAGAVDSVPNLEFEFATPADVVRDRQTHNREPVRRHLFSLVLVLIGIAAFGAAIVAVLGK